MRIKIKFTKNLDTVSIHNQSLLNSYIHKCLGRNNQYHDTKSHYNISHLYGGKLNVDKETLSFINGGYIIVSSKDQEFINKLLIGIINNPEFVSGMRFAGVDHINEKFVDGWNYFSTLSPFIIKKYIDNKTYKFLSLKDEDFQSQLKNYLINKLSKIDFTLDLKNFDIIIPKSNSHKLKKIMVKNVVNVANQCQLNIFSNKKVIETLYNIGIGQSTGSGFGTIYKTENHRFYR